MVRTAERSRLSGVEYLAWERDQETRHEFFDGEVFAMAGGSLRHSALAANVIAELKRVLAGRDCMVMTSDQRVRTGAGERYVYPDASVIYGPAKLAPGTSDVLANPAIVVEVLSTATEPYDRGLKWEGYQRLDSLSDYILVSQDELRMEHFRREGASSWLYRAVGVGERLALATHDVELLVNTIFDGVLALPRD